MVTKLIRTVNNFTGKSKQPIKLEILAKGVAADAGSLNVIEFMDAFYQLPLVLIALLHIA